MYGSKKKIDLLDSIANIKIVIVIVYNAKI